MIAVVVTAMRTDEKLDKGYEWAGSVEEEAEAWADAMRTAIEALAPASHSGRSPHTCRRRSS